MMSPEGRGCCLAGCREGTREASAVHHAFPLPFSCRLLLSIFCVYFCCGFTVESVCLLFCWRSRCWAGQACVRAMSALGLENSGRSLAFSFLPLLCCFTLAGQGRAGHASSLLPCSAFCVFMVCRVNALTSFSLPLRSIFFEEIMLASILYLFSLYSR